MKASVVLSNPHKLWKIYTDEALPLMVIEYRKGETLEVYYQCVNVATGAVNSVEIPLKHTWWTGIEVLYQGKAIFHTFHHAQYAAHVGLYCVEVIQNQPLWAFDKAVYFDFSSSHVIAYPLGKPYNLHSIEWDSGVIAPCSVSFEAKPLKKHYLSPYVFATDAPEFDLVAQFVTKINYPYPVGKIEYLEHNESIFLAFYVNNNDETFDKHFLVLNTGGEVVLHTLIEKAVKIQATDCFFIFADKLCVITHHQTISIYDLLP